jgi:uncharacterized protein
VELPSRQPPPRERALKAAASEQIRLLDVQNLDTRLDQLAHRRATLPEHAAIAAKEQRLAELRDALVLVQTEESDLGRELRKAESDVDQVRQRSERDQKRLDAGQVGSPRDLENLQHEIQTLAKRQNDLEEVVLEVMERVEDAQTRRAGLEAEQEEVRAGLLELSAARDTTTSEIDAEIAQLREQRQTQAGALDVSLVELYEKIRAQQAGIGAAELRQRRCSGCRLEINSIEMGRLRAADQDEVLRCEECRRILVRTPESGL